MGKVFGGGGIREQGGGRWEQGEREQNSPSAREILVPYQGAKVEWYYSLGIHVPIDKMQMCSSSYSYAIIYYHI